MIYTRHCPTGQVINTLDLKYLTQNVTSLQLYLGVYELFMKMDKIIYTYPVAKLDGYCDAPDRYWVRTANDVVCVLVHPDPDNEIQRFVWKKADGVNDIVVTEKITKESLVFLKIQSDTLSYENDDKLLFIECSPTYKHPISIMFFDNFGLPQTVELETGEWETAIANVGTFRSITNEVQYPIDKLTSNSLTVGDTTIPRELSQFYSGLATSRAYKVLLDGYNTINTNIEQPQTVADSFTKTYSFTGVLKFDSKDIPALLYKYGELNIND